MAKKPENYIKMRLIRIPKKIDEQLQKRAESNKRSVNNQIVYELDQVPNNG